MLALLLSPLTNPVPPPGYLKEINLTNYYAIIIVHIFENVDNILNNLRQFR